MYDLIFVHTMSEVQYMHVHFLFVVQAAPTYCRKQTNCPPGPNYGSCQDLIRPHFHACNDWTQ
jgi:hypothetical protein